MPALAPARAGFAPVQEAVHSATQWVQEERVVMSTAVHHAAAWAKQPVAPRGVPKGVFITVGLLLLCMLCVVPVWNAFALMTDGNFVFWVGRLLPVWMIVICLSVVLTYVILCLFYFSYAANPGDERNVLTMANMFVMLLGMSLMIVSLPLTRNSVETYNNLMYRCDDSHQTARMWEYSQVLHNIRMTPACAQKFSVEECAGYSDAAPYTSFLKAMESDFRCSGFCYRPPTAVPGPVAVSVPAPAPALASSTSSTSLLLRHRPRPHGRGRHHHRLLSRQGAAAPRSLLEERESTSRVDAESTRQISERLDGMAHPMPVHALYPPTLFSDANYQVSCEGMAARDVRNFGGDIGYQTFYQGVYLVGIAIAMGFLKVIGLCIPNGGGVLERAVTNPFKAF